MGNEETWSMAEVLVGLNMLNYLDSNRGVPCDNYATHFISLLLLSHGSNLDKLLFIHREYERPLHIMTASGENADTIEDVVQGKIEELPMKERAMIEVLVELSKDKVPS